MYKKLEFDSMELKLENSIFSRIHHLNIVP